MKKKTSYFTTSLALLKNSWHFLLKNKDLLWLPIVSLCGQVLIVAATTAFVVMDVIHVVKRQSHPEIALNMIDHLISYYPVLSMLLGVVCFLLLVFLLNFVSLYCNTSLIVCAHQRLQGKVMTLSQALHATKKHMKKLLQWAFTAMLIHMLIRHLERVRFIGPLLALGASVAWALVTYFVLPIMIFQNIGPIDAIKSARTKFTRSWRRVISVNGIIILFSVLLCAGLYLIARVAPQATSSLFAVGIGIAALTFLFIITFGAALQGVVKAAMYLSVFEDVTPTCFSDDVLQNAVVRRNRYLKNK
jgi:hypothetical protein